MTTRELQVLFRYCNKVDENNVPNIITTNHIISIILSLKQVLLKDCINYVLLIYLKMHCNITLDTIHELLQCDEKWYYWCYENFDNSHITDSCNNRKCICNVLLLSKRTNLYIKHCTPNLKSNFKCLKRCKPNIIHLLHACKNKDYELGKWLLQNADLSELDDKDNYSLDRYNLNTCLSHALMTDTLNLADLIELELIKRKQPIFLINAYIHHLTISVEGLEWLYKRKIGLIDVKSLLNGGYHKTYEETRWIFEHTENLTIDNKLIANVVRTCDRELIKWFNSTYMTNNIRNNIANNNLKFKVWYGIGIEHKNDFFNWYCKYFKFTIEDFNQKCYNRAFWFMNVPLLEAFQAKHVRLNVRELLKLSYNYTYTTSKEFVKWCGLNIPFNMWPHEMYENLFDKFSLNLIKKIFACEINIRTSAKLRPVHLGHYSRDVTDWLVSQLGPCGFCSNKKCSYCKPCLNSDCSKNDCVKYYTNQKKYKI